MNPCSNCDMVDYCAEIGRCFRKGIETDTFDGVLTDEDEVNEIQLRKEKKVKTPKKLTDEHVDFLKDVINF